MRAKEFTINVPINIKINGDGDPEIDVAGQGEPEPDDADPVFVGPQQQQIELDKVANGKKSIVGAQLTDDAEDQEIN